MSALPLPHHSPADYLAFDRQSDTRHEYFDGVIYAMAGGSYNHVTVTNNFSRILGNLLLDRDCNVTSSDARVQVAATGPFFYPDVVVVCGAPQFADDHSYAVTNPVLLVEVLSPSTETFDRTTKFEQYRRLESLREYVLVSQTEARVQSFCRQADETWKQVEAAGLKAVYQSRSLSVSAVLSDIYRKVSLPETRVSGK